MVCVGCSSIVAIRSSLTLNVSPRGRLDGARCAGRLMTSGDRSPSLPMAARVLVAYATKHGSTREIAEYIARTLRDPGVQTAVASARSVKDVAPYDAVILGSALYAAHWRRDANRFVTGHLATLQVRPVWLFSSGPLDRSADAGRIPIAPQVAA